MTTDEHTSKEIAELKRRVIDAIIEASRGWPTHPVSWLEVTRQLGERVARLEAVGQLVDAKLAQHPGEAAAEAINDAVADRLLGMIPQLEQRIARMEATTQLVDFKTRSLDGTLDDLGPSELAAEMRRRAESKGLRSDRYLKQLLGPEEYEVMQRRLVMVGPRITSEAPPTDPREADLQEAAQTIDGLQEKLAEAQARLTAARAQRDAGLAAVASIADRLELERGEHVGQMRDRIIAKLDGLLISDSIREVATAGRVAAEAINEAVAKRMPPKHNDLARRIRESDFIQGLEDRQGDHDWAREQTDGDLLDHVFARLNHAVRLEIERDQIDRMVSMVKLGEVSMIAGGSLLERVADGLERARAEGRREADVERAALVAKLQLVREALGATLQPDGTDDVVDKARNRQPLGAIMDRELEWCGVVDVIADRLGLTARGSLEATRTAILDAIAKLQGDLVTE